MAAGRLFSRAGERPAWQTAARMIHGNFFQSDGIDFSLQSK
jgi:hypothetical protein